MAGPAGDHRPSSRSVFPGFADAQAATSTGGLVRLLAERRRSDGLSQTELAARMGTSQSAIARLEAPGADVRLSTLARYAAALEVEVGFALLDEPDDTDTDATDTDATDTDARPGDEPPAGTRGSDR